MRDSTCCHEARKSYFTTWPSMDESIIYPIYPIYPIYRISPYFQATFSVNTMPSSPKYGNLCQWIYPQIVGSSDYPQWRSDLERWPRSFGSLIFWWTLPWRVFLGKRRKRYWCMPVGDSVARDFSRNWVHPMHPSFQKLRGVDSVINGVELVI